MEWTGNKLVRDVGLSEFKNLDDQHDLDIRVQV